MRFWMIPLLSLLLAVVVLVKTSTKAVVVAGEVVVPGLKETLIDLLMILKVKLGGFLHRRLSRVGMAAGEALGLTVLEGILVALDLIVLKVKMERLSCLGEVSG